MDQNVIESILNMLIKNVPALSGVLVVLGSLVVLGQIVVVLTPSKKDEEAYDKLMAIPIVGTLVNIITKFSVIQKK